MRVNVLLLFAVVAALLNSPIIALLLLFAWSEGQKLPP